MIMWLSPVVAVICMLNSTGVYYDMLAIFCDVLYMWYYCNISNIDITYPSVDDT